MPSLPSSANFDVYDVTAGVPMGDFLLYAEVDHIEVMPGHFDKVVGGANDGDLIMASGTAAAGGPDPDLLGPPLVVGSPPVPQTVRVVVGTSVPDIFTFEASICFDKLPADFTNVTASHAFFGVSDEQGGTFGLFFSKVGVAYTGSVYYGSGNLQINSPVQLLPDSIGLVSEGTYYTIRVATDSASKTTYIFLTETSRVATFGHTLRYVLPAFLSDSGAVPPNDASVLSLRGSSLSPVALRLQTISICHGQNIPNLPPSADAGRDQAARLASIVRFDGRASFDPEGAPLTYFWRLIDGPDVSVFVRPGYDGETHGGVLTDLFYSPTLADIHASESIEAGDVLSVGGSSYEILGTGTDGYGFYVQIDGANLDGSLSGQIFRLLKQKAISDRTSAQPSFFPDVSGLFRFDLTVSDGDLKSLPATLVVNVLESPVPRGITPDVSFLWNYISDFWKLVENTDVIQTFWEALAQITASELLTLWQHDYGKSLRDVQRTFQRRWLHYDFFLREPFPELTKVGLLLGGAEISGLPVGMIASPDGWFNLTFESPLYPSSAVFVGNNGGLDAEQISSQLRRQLQAIDKWFQVDTYQDVAGAEARIFIRAPFPFRLSGTSWLGDVDVINTQPTGTNGAAVGTTTYLVDRRLDLSGIVQGDFLVIDGVAYQIARILTGTGDPWAGQRIVTYDELPINAGKDWRIARGTVSSFVDFYKALCSSGDFATYEVIDLATQGVTFVTTSVLSAYASESSCLLVDIDPLAGFLAQPSKYSVYFHSTYRRTHLPIEASVVDVPRLQEKIKNPDDSEVLRQNIDYYVDQYRGRPCLRFVSSGAQDVWEGGAPPLRMWAEVTYLDNRSTIEANFGLPADFTLDDLSQLPSTSDYLSIVQGLWYAYFNGPTLYNLRVGTQILLGLPFAEVAGTIEEIRDDFSSSTGRFLIRDLDAKEVVRSYVFPTVLELETNPSTGAAYAVGDEVAQFAPLTKGVEVTDYVKDPSWYEKYMNQGAFYEVEKFFKFLVRIDSDAFSLNTLLFAQSFIKRIKPTYTYPLFIVRKDLEQTTIDVSDVVYQSGRLYLNEWPLNFEYNGVDFGHVGGAFDDPRPAFGGWRGKFDGDYYDGTPSVGTPPTYPTSWEPIHWGYDREKLIPESLIVGTCSWTLASAGTPLFDGIFSFDLPLLSKIFGTFGTTTLLVPLVPPASHSIKLGVDVVCSSSGTVNFATLEYRTSFPLATPMSISVKYFKNSVLAGTSSLVIPAFGDYLTALPLVPSSFSVSSGDVLSVTVEAQVSGYPLPGGSRFFVTLGEGVTWMYDQNQPGGPPALPAGTYKKSRML